MLISNKASICISHIPSPPDIEVVTSIAPLNLGTEWMYRLCRICGEEKAVYQFIEHDITLIIHDYGTDRA